MASASSSWLTPVLGAGHDRLDPPVGAGEALGLGEREAPTDTAPAELSAVPNEQRADERVLLCARAG